MELGNLRIDPDPSPLGRGGFGKVIAGKYQHADVAIKFAEHGSKTLLSELRMLRRVRHPNLVFFYGASFIGDRLCILEERIHGPTLRDIMDGGQEDALSAKNRHAILCGICAAVVHLHSQDPAIVHGDLKPSNVLIESANNKVAPSRLLVV